MFEKVLFRSSLGMACHDKKACCQINIFLQFENSNWCTRVFHRRADLTEAKKQRSLLGAGYKSTEMSFCKLKTKEKIFPLTCTVIRKHHILKSSQISKFLPFKINQLIQDYLSSMWGLGWSHNTAKLAAIR